MTVEQYQGLHQIYKSEDSPIEKAAAAVALIHDLSQKAVDDMPMAEFNVKAAAIYKEYEDAVRNPQPTQLLGNYQVNYNLATYRSAQFTEVRGG